MDHSQTGNHNSRPTYSTDNIDEVDFENFDFKVINKGLGFHNEEKRTSFQRPSSDTTRAYKGKKHISRVNSVSNLGITQEISGVNKSGLEAFYGEKSSSISQTNRKVQNTKPDLHLDRTTKVQASFFMCSVAWPVDLILIFLVTFVTIGLFIFSSGIEYKQLLTLVSNTDKYVFFSLVFSTYYLLYFSILDLASSPGKALMGLSLEKVDDSNLRFKNTFVRAMVTLISLFTLGIPYFFNLHNKLSKTRVVQ